MNTLFSILYMLAFALCGVLIARPVFRRDDPLRRVFFGLVFGLVMLIWLPTLFAFLIDFTLLAQLLALAAAVVGAAAACVFSAVRLKNAEFGRFKEGDLKKLLPLLLIAFIPITAVCFILHFSHTIVTASDGSLHVGQCTYGDLCMHLGFISSISVQKTFPPVYSLLPGTPLGYPFLCDSVSSTFFTLGASLRLAALLPALYACVVTVLGVFFFFDTWFKKHGTACLATYIFFIGGGFGFWYFFNNKLILADQGVDRMQELLTGFYKMPTNLPDEGLRWVNAIADMLLPQRATLFGWSLLFPALQLLYRGAIEKENRVFIPLGVIAGSMPLVHTHSFLGLGIISAFLFVSLLFDQFNKRNRSRNCRLAVWLMGCFTGMLIFAVLFKLPIRVAQENANVLAVSCGCFALGLVGFLTAACFLAGAVKNRRSAAVPAILGGAALLCGTAASYGAKRGSILVLLAPAAGLALALLVAIFAKKEPASLADDGTIPSDKECRQQLRDGWKTLLFFAVFGVITLLLACPQLFGFTLKQSGSSDSFLRWQLNWDNRSDSWLWFYIKNLGLIFILLVPGFLFLKKRDKLFCGGGLVIWAVAEILLFQPNPYDNNKLLFVWFALACGITANFLMETIGKPALLADGKIDGAKTAARFVLLVIAFAALFTSGLMTINREYVSADHWGEITEEDGTTHFGYDESGYELTPAYLVKMTEWVKANTEPDAVFLTYNNHNNAIAMLTGRSIFCGSGTFLHWHGVNYRPRERLLDDMFEHPGDCLMEYAEEYGISYVLISPFEANHYSVDTAWFEKNLKVVYENPRVTIYRIP